MLKVGVTGGIGSGKSLACKIFVSFGIPVYEADSRAKYLIEHDPEIIRNIKKIFGDEAYDNQNNYNRPFISASVFKNKDLLLQLNAVVHPAVARDFETWASSFHQSPYIIKEAAIMNAAGKSNDLDKVIVVISPDDLRIERIKERDTHRTMDEIKGIIKNQKSEGEFRAIADFILINDDHSLLVPQILQVHKQLLSLAGNEK